MEEKLERLKKIYKLSTEENQKIEDKIIKMMLYGKRKVKNPKAIFNIGPPGSGKTGLNGYGVSQFENNNVVVINNDELKPFHPKADEIARLYPEYYTKITNQESIKWTDNLVDKVISEGYNVMYEGTGRKLELFKNMINKMDGYDITIRAIAVNDLNCLMSILERYEYQVKTKGWGRLVSLDTFYKAYKDEMLDTLNALENLKEVNDVEVFLRGNNPVKPIKIYSNKDNNKKYINAKSAVIYGRNIDKEKAKKYYKEYYLNTINVLDKDKCSKDEIEIINKIENLHKDLQKNELINER